MKSSEIKLVTFESTTAIADYWQTLESRGLDYHLDDAPETIWQPGRLPVVERHALITNHNRMWEYCRQQGLNPWHHISFQPDPDSQYRQYQYDTYKTDLRVATAECHHKLTFSGQTLHPPPFLLLSV